MIFFFVISVIKLGMKLLQNLIFEAHLKLITFSESHNMFAGSALENFEFLKLIMKAQPSKCDPDKFKINLFTCIGV